MTYPLITICIVTYNHQDYIEDCLSSALAQKGNFKLQILIGDDASDDTTIAIAKSIADQHGKTIQIYAHKKNLGASQNYQFLINKAQGDFIAHLDGDDFWLPGKLKAQLSFLNKHNSCIACCTNAIVVSNEKEPKGFFNYPQENYITLETLLKKGNFLNHSSLLYRKKGKKIVLGFPGEFIDFQIHLNLAQHGQFGYINQALVAYRVNSNNSMLKMMPEKVMLLYCQALLSLKNNVSDNLFLTGINTFIRNIFFNLIMNKQYKTLIRILRILRKEKVLSIQSILALAISSFFYEIKQWLKKPLQNNNLKTLQKNN